MLDYCSMCAHMHLHTQVHTLAVQQLLFLKTGMFKLRNTKGVYFCLKKKQYFIFIYFISFTFYILYQSRCLKLEHPGSTLTDFSLSSCVFISTVFFNPDTEQMSKLWSDMLKTRAIAHVPRAAELPPPWRQPAALAQARLPPRAEGSCATSAAALGLLFGDRLCCRDSVWVSSL